MIDHEYVIHCDAPGCDATISNDRWSKTRSGWFQLKDGHDFCPEHTPAWVADWRARRRSP